MSNRVLGILILLGFIGLGYIYYSLVYIPELESIKSEQAKIQNEIEEKKKAIKRKIKLIAEKKVDNKISNKEKIQQIKEKSLNYKTFYLDNNKKVFFRKNRLGKLDLFFDNKKIGVFDLVYKKYLFVSLIRGTENNLYIEIGKNKYIYDNETKLFKEIYLNIKVLYVKKDINYIFVTSKGSFVYKNKKLEYFSFFKDFIYFKDGYLGIINKKDKLIINNLGIKDFTKENIIFYYNPFTKKKKKLFDIDDYYEIYKQDNKIYIKFKDKSLYRIVNLEKNI